MTAIAYKHLDVARITSEILNREGADGWVLAHVEEMVSPAPVEGSQMAGDLYPFCRLWLWRENRR